MKSIDDIPEYREMRRGLRALYLEVDPSIADDVLARCEKAILTVRGLAYEQGRADERECRAGMPG